MWDPVTGTRSLDGGPFGGGGFNPNAAVIANDINTGGTVVGMNFAGSPIKWDAANGTRAAFAGAFSAKRP